MFHALPHKQVSAPRRQPQYLRDYLDRVHAEESAASEFDYRAVACVAPEVADWLDPSCALRDAGLMTIDH